jgi:integrase
MSSSYRKRPLAQFEHGTRIYAPTPAEHRFRVVTTDPATSQRVFAKLPSEAAARARAREFEHVLSAVVPLGQTRGLAPRTVQALAERYTADHLVGLSVRYRQKQEYLLRVWILPRLGRILVDQWTPADSAAVLASVRQHGRSNSLVQDVGAAMRSLVTHARRLRWFTSQSEDPMWMVSYSKRGTIQGVHDLHVARNALPTDEQCADLFRSMQEAGEHRWALAMRLKHRTGVRWGELVALRPNDITFEPRVVHVHRAVEHGRGMAPALKLPKNGRIRTTIFPKSIVEELREHTGQVRASMGGDGLLFPGPRGGIMRRTAFQSVWVKAADRAGWPMRRPLQRTTGYGEKGKGWRWTGAALWTPHDLRHVAACWMLFDLGLDPAVVANKLGHSDPSFTVKRYVGVRGDPDRAAMAVTEDW